MSGLDALRRRLRRDAPDSGELESRHLRPSEQAHNGEVSRYGGRDPGESRAGRVGPLLAEARARLDEIALTSERASEAIRQSAGLDGAAAEDRGEATPTVQDLMAALVERIEAMQEEALRLATLLDRTQGKLETGSVPATALGPGSQAARRSRPNGDDGEPGEHGPVPMEQVRALVALLAGAGASRQEIAAWVFREHGVVVSDSTIEAVMLSHGEGA